MRAASGKHSDCVPRFHSANQFDMPCGFLIREDTVENMHVRLCQAKLRQEGACWWQHGAARTSNVRKSQLVLGLTRMRGSAAAPACLVVCQWPGSPMRHHVHAHGGRAMLRTVQAGYTRMRGDSNMSTALTCFSQGLHCGAHQASVRTVMVMPLQLDASG